MSDADVVVIGSGISGSFAAKSLVDQGFTVVLVDVGQDDARLRESIPDLPFSKLIKDLEVSEKVFLGENEEGIAVGSARVGAQLTPPRQFVTRGAEDLLPYESKSFFPMQTAALGGLGAGWGAASFTYTDYELKKCGIWETGFAKYYEKASRIAGISAPFDDDTFEDTFNVSPDSHQPPMRIDENCETIFAAYKKNPASKQGYFRLGRAPLAMLSEDREDGRRANPYHDMDFYSDSRKSIFRPRYLLEKLKKLTNFRYVNSQLVLKVEQKGDFVEVVTKDTSSAATRILKSKKVIVCAGAIGTARIILNSFKDHRSTVPLLANPYHYLACVNWRTFGRSVRDQRHSMTQLVGVHRPAESPDDLVNFQFYSYRSLLMFKLAKEFPLPPKVGMLVARTLVNSLTIVAVWHSCSQNDLAFAQAIEPTSDGGGPAKLSLEFSWDAAHRQRVIARNKAVGKYLRSLKVYPLSSVDTGPAGGIHYAGTLPIASEAFRSWTLPTGQLRDNKNVFIGDSASWNYLPAKGLSITLMASALRVAEHLGRELRANEGSS